MTSKLRSFSAIAVTVASALLAANANAVAFDLTNPPASLNNTNPGNQFSVTVSGITLTAHAYATSVATPPATLAQRAASSWQAETLQLDSRGIGAGPNGVLQPNFSVGNQGRQEVIVIEASRAMNWNSFILGFATNGQMDANGQLVSSNVRLQAWTGGNGLAANYNFAANGVCFSGAACSIGSNTLANLGFNQSVSLNSDASNSPMNFGFTNSGKFLVLSGDLGLTTAAFGSEQFFQLKSLSATAPEPGSIALLLLGLAGFAVARRRTAA
jgi:hypothetical protein